MLTSSHLSSAATYQTEGSESESLSSPSALLQESANHKQLGILSSCNLNARGNIGHDLNPYRKQDPAVYDWLTLVLGKVSITERELDESHPHIPPSGMLLLKAPVTGARS